jgi:CRP/FNR family cyclic AMP-dependent transcriptional regulator
MSTGDSSVQREHDILQVLGRTELFADLSQDDLRACTASFREVRFKKGELLFARGDPGTRLYVMRDGQVRLAIGTREGRDLSFQIAEVGQLFGELALLDEQPRSAEATAITTCVAYALEKQQFDMHIATRPGVARAVISFLCRRLRNASDRLESIALYPLEARVARFLLLAMHGREGTPGKRVPLALGFSQSELAMLLGASRPKINLALGALEQAGAIRRTSDRLFCDPEKLAVLSQKGPD